MARYRTMRPGFLILCATVFMMMDVNADGKYVKALKSWKKYYKMAAVAIAGWSAYMLVTKRSGDAQQAFVAASQLTSTLPSESQVQAVLEARVAPRPNKRSVSGLRKKVVAANQGWKCQNCGNMLNAWFEVDHIQSLENGGTNDESNLVALCRECHGQKTTLERM